MPIAEAAGKTLDTLFVIMKYYLPIPDSIYHLFVGVKKHSIIEALPVVVKASLSVEALGAHGPSVHKTCK